jgi:hypothetical protein
MKVSGSPEHHLLIKHIMKHTSSLKFSGLHIKEIDEININPIYSKCYFNME